MAGMTGNERPMAPYPVARRDDVVDDYHGTLVPDPYRWLEDAESPETQTWVEAQNARTRAFLDAIPAREQIKARLTQLWDYPKYSVPHKKSGRYFFWKNDGLQNQSVLYWQPSLEAAPQVVIDPNALSEDGTTAVNSHAASEDGRLLAYGLSHRGSDWQELHVRAVDTGYDYPDLIRWCKFAGIAWKHDRSGFYYNRLPKPGTVPEDDQNCYQRVYWHRLGTDQAEDVLVYERPDDKELGFAPFVTDDGAYLVLHVWRGTEPKNRIYYRPVEAGGDFVRLLDDADARYLFIDNAGPVFYFHTTLNAPRGRILAIDTRQPGRAHRREVVPEQDDVLSFVTMVNDHLVAAYLHDVHHVLKLYTFDGAYVRDVPLPGLGSIVGLSGRRTDTEMFLGFTSFLYPTAILRYDFRTAAMETVHAPALDFAAAAHETTQVFYTSKDGTRVPMFLTHQKGLALDGSHSTLLYGYGGFDVSLTPAFNVSRLAWLERGGVYAVANLRGGGEYGEAWHQAGTLARKQNVFDDFIAAAEWLIAHGYTRSGKLAILGGSNGGLLVAACLVQRPDLFGAVVCAVPVIDMLRYHRFSVGRYWVTDYGNAEADPEHFCFLYAYSPLHNLHPGIAYPATLITSADTDDRVVPAHAKKFAAALQPAQAGDAPILLRVETKTGHGLGKPTAKVIDEQADSYAFLTATLGLEGGNGELRP